MRSGDGGYRAEWGRRTAGRRTRRQCSGWGDPFILPNPISDQDRYNPAPMLLAVGGKTVSDTVRAKRPGGEFLATGFRDGFPAPEAPRDCNRAEADGYGNASVVSSIWGGLVGRVGVRRAVVVGSVIVGPSALGLSRSRSPAMGRYRTAAMARRRSALGRRRSALGRRRSRRLVRAIRRGGRGAALGYRDAGSGTRPGAVSCRRAR